MAFLPVLSIVLSVLIVSNFASASVEVVQFGNSSIFAQREAGKAPHFRLHAHLTAGAAPSSQLSGKRDSMANNDITDPITYNSGPVQTSPISINLILYGNFKNTSVGIISDWVKGLNNCTCTSVNPNTGLAQPLCYWWAVSATYYQTVGTSKVAVSRVVNLGNIYYDNYSLGKTALNDGSVTELVEKYVPTVVKSVLTTTSSVTYGSITNVGVQITGFSTTKFNGSYTYASGTKTATVYYYTDSKLGFNVTTWYPVSVKSGSKYVNTYTVQVVKASWVVYNWPLVQSNDFYAVLTASDVTFSGFGTSFCGYHSGFSLSAYPYPTAYYTWVGDASVQFPQQCSGMGSTCYRPPNGDCGADGIINALGHEVSEYSNDMDGSAWYDIQGNESGDKCAYNFGLNTKYVYPAGPLPLGQANLCAGSRNFFVQQIWDQSTSKCCLNKNVNAGTGIYA
eukprot:TRINITY_DN453_c0_g1_i2.p1 TRINITY_DN453_c0_g1~~TRINITY_DN453_c0_g1_i2.p1  ORF type:complete len:451 (+),score=33.78 TRINITY_DN453_c0_g1_i2:416-1768(+)